MTALPITRLTLREAFSRRLILAALILSAVYLALVGLGFWFLRGRIEDLDGTIAATALTVLALYVVSFLSAFLAMLLSAGSVSGEVDSGQLHAVLARPIARRSWLLQRWLGLAVLAVPYSVGMGAGVLIIAGLAVDYSSVDVAGGLALLALQTLLLLSLGMVISTRLSTLAGGAVLFFLFALAWLAGIVELIGALIDNDPMQTIGVVVSLLIPSDALWKGASYLLASPALHAATGARPESLPPFIGAAPAAAEFVAWTVVYVVAALAIAVRGFARRDL